MKSLRYLLFIPLAILLTGLIYLSLSLVIGAITFGLFWAFSKMNIFLFVLCLLTVLGVFVVLLYGIFKTACVFLILLVREVSPSLMFAFYTFLILIISGAIFNVYGIWMANDLSAFSIVMNIIFTLVTIGFSGTMLKAAGVIPKDKAHLYPAS